MKSVNVIMTGARGWRDAGAALLWALLFTAASSRAATAYVIGITTHTPNAENLDLMRGMDIHWTRNDLPWAKIELQKDHLVMPDVYDQYVDGALQRQMQPLLILDYGNPMYGAGGYPVTREATDGFIRYVEFVVAHFKGRVQKYEVWNEWNGHCGMTPGTPAGEAEAYVNLLKKVYPRIKAIDPGAEVIGGALAGTGVESGWLKRACDAGMLAYLDAFSFHPYSYSFHLYSYLGEGERLPETVLLGHILEVKNIIDGYPHRPTLGFYLTEIGWPTHRSHDGSTGEQSARYLTRTMLLLHTLPYIKGVWWYDWSDDGLDPKNVEHNFGVVTHSLTPKPGYFAIRELEKCFDGAQSVELVPKLDSVRVVHYAKGADKNLYALWALRGAFRYQARLTVDGANQPPLLAATDSAHGDFTREWRRAGAGKWRLDLTVDEDPLFIDPGADTSPALDIVENPTSE
jgi:hypothetical protein